MTRLVAAGASDIGAHRATNQDAGFTASWGAAVADGVGGGPSGDLASATLLHRLVAGALPVADADQLAERVRLANWDIRARIDHDGSLRGMSTTFTGLFVGREGQLLLAHVGDSRAYLLRDDVLTQMTRDDSYVQELVDHGLIAADAAERHPSPAEAARAAVVLALEAGTRDNVTVLVCDVVEGAAERGAPVFYGSAAERFTERLEGGAP